MALPCALPSGFQPVSWFFTHRARESGEREVSPRQLAPRPERDLVTLRSLALPVPWGSVLVFCFLVLFIYVFFDQDDWHL